MANYNYNYNSLFSIRRLWIIFAVSMLVMFGTLLYFGAQIYQAAPPIPTAVRSAAGETLFTREQIQRGQNVWQSTGGMQQGSVWGHGSYVAPDWSADWLHREALALVNAMAQKERGSDYAALGAPEQARLRTMLQQEMRSNTYDPQSGLVTVTDERARAIEAVGSHYSDLFRGELRRGASPAQGLCIPGRRHSHARGIGGAERVLLLDGMGRDHEPARRFGDLHE